MKSHLLHAFVLGASVLLLVPHQVRALDDCAVSGHHDGRCDSCGCNHGSNKVCKLICIEKEITVTCWKCECEEFCVPCPSTKCEQHCQEVCGCKDGGGCGKLVKWWTWSPGSAQVRTKKKLLRKKVKVKVPSYKWVMVDACGACESKLEPAPLDVPGVPKPPAVDAKYDYSAVKHLVAPVQIANKKNIRR